MLLRAETVKLFQHQGTVQPFRKTSKTFHPLIVFSALAIAVFFLIIFPPQKTLAKILTPENQLFSPEILNSLERMMEIRKPETSPDPLQKYRGKIVEKVNLKTANKTIALTFDDGPDGKTTLEVLDILERYKVKATFFLIGENVKKYPYVTRRLVERGHAIGNHTLTHAYHSMNPENTAREIEETSDAIEQLTQTRPILFRPPLGRRNNGLVDYAESHDYITVLWSINSDDSVGYPGVKTITANVINRAQSGGIVLLHDAPWYRWKTIAALPSIIERLKNQGYRFVTVPELLALN